MRILRVINSLDIGGAERSIVNNVPLHVANGYDMDVLLLDGRRTFFLEELQARAVNVEWLGCNISVYNPLLAFKLLPILKKYDLVHAHLFPAFYWVAFAKILSRSSTILVCTEHNTHNRRRDSVIFKWVDRLVYSQYARIIAISDAAKLSIDKHTGTPAKSVVIPNGVQIAALRGSTGELSEDWRSRIRGKKVLVQVAGFRPEKDQDTTIRALAELPEDYVAIFIGDGERRSACMYLAEELGVANRAFFAGIQSEVAPFINAADLVVMSSHWEGFGRAAVEGMALGKPVVASNVSGLSEIVNGAGRLFEVGDYKALSEAVVELLEDPAAYAEASMRCRARSDKYDVKYMIEGYEQVYASVAADRD